MGISARHVRATVPSAQAKSRRRGGCRGDLPCAGGAMRPRYWPTYGGSKDLARATSLGAPHTALIRENCFVYSTHPDEVAQYSASVMLYWRVMVPPIFERPIRSGAVSHIRICHAIHLLSPFRANARLPPS